MLELGIKAPDFELPDQNGEVHKLSDYLGKKIILYFYPKDNTPGCTKQACFFSFQTSYASITLRSGSANSVNASPYFSSNLL